MCTDFILLFNIVPEVPSNVTLQVVGADSVRMTWDAPKSKYEVKGYVIHWRKSDEEQKPIVVGDKKEYKFNNLGPGQSITTSVCAFIDEKLFKEKQLTGPCSKRKSGILPHKKKCRFSSIISSKLISKIAQLVVIIHTSSKCIDVSQFSLQPRANC